MTTSKLSMVKAAQQLDESVQITYKLLVEFASEINTTPDILIEDVNHVLTNFKSNLDSGQGLTSLGTNLRNYAYFLAGVEVIMNAMSHPEKAEAIDMADAVRQLGGLSIIKHGNTFTVSENVQNVIDLGASPQYTKIALKYAALLKDVDTNPAPLSDAIGLLQYNLNQVRLAAKRKLQDTTAPVQSSVSRPTLPRSTPSMSGVPPAGGSI